MVDKMAVDIRNGISRRKFHCSLRLPTCYQNKALVASNMSNFALHRAELDHQQQIRLNHDLQGARLQGTDEA